MGKRAIVTAAPVDFTAPIVETSCDGSPRHGTLSRMPDPRPMPPEGSAGAARPGNDWHLEILYRDDYLVAVNKPTALLVHRSPVSRDQEFAVQRLREQLGRRVFPAHRLDRATSGVLLFSLDPETGRAAAMCFQEGRVDKRYLAVLRGWTEEFGTIEHALKSEDKTRTRNAITHYRRLATTEVEHPVGPHPTARYSLARALDRWPEDFWWDDYNTEAV